jgi:hypothetical protein
MLPAVGQWQRQLVFLAELGPGSPLDGADARLVQLEVPFVFGAVGSYSGRQRHLCCEQTCPLMLPSHTAPLPLEAAGQTAQ